MVKLARVYYCFPNIMFRYVPIRIAIQEVYLSFVMFCRITPFSDPNTTGMEWHFASFKPLAGRRST